MKKKIYATLLVLTPMLQRYPTIVTLILRVKKHIKAVNSRQSRGYVHCFPIDRAHYTL